MRPFNDKQNVQKKSYYTDRFRTQPTLARYEAQSDAVFQKDIEELSKVVSIKESYIEIDQLVIWVERKEIKKALTCIKELGYENLSEMSAVDFLAQQQGFEIFYQLLSMQKRKRVRLKCFLPQKESLESVESVYKSANWAEREAYDMFGIVFTNHPYLKRILLPDDWHGHPLLKTYPLQGDEEARWYEIDKIFGKEHREVVGEEQRDSARVDENDTKNFSHINHEVPYNMPPSKDLVETGYQEKDGIAIVKHLRKEDSKTIKGRR